ncbi:sigma factor E [Wolffia australiana]
MGVVSVPSSASRLPLGSNSKFSRSQNCRRPVILAFKIEKRKNKSFSSQQDTIALGIDSVKDPNSPVKRVYSDTKRKAVCVDEASSIAELDYDEVAAVLENLYKISPGDISQLERSDQALQKRSRRRKISKEDASKKMKAPEVFKNDKKKPKRLSLLERISMKKKGSVEEGSSRDVLDRLVRDYSVSTDLVSLDWKKMKIPAVLSSSDHTFLFKLLLPAKAAFEIKDNLHKELGREPTDGELARATNMSVLQLRRQLEVGHAARNKLIKHNLRLVLFAINKYYHEIANGQKFQDLCQAGVKGLITAIDRFESKRGFRLSTYALFWIRHAIIRSMTISSFARVPFGIESVRQEIQRAKLELTFELKREPTDQEIVSRVGISPDRYKDILRASKPVASLNARHATTQEEFIKGVADVDGVSGDRRRQPALLRLALDDVLDSLKPKESLVIRQRYGLDGKGDRTLGEIAGNLSISREMVRKHEVKALMKLKHPARVDYLRRHIV